MRHQRFSFCLFLMLFATSLFAQVADDFSDGDFSNAPAWLGSMTDFSISTGQLRSASTTSNSTFYLSTADTLSQNCHWEFWCRLAFNPSSSNYVDVYLMADNSNLSSTTFNGYFIRLGNTLDEICLYKRTGSTLLKLIDGADGVLNTANNQMRICVRYEPPGQWTLERDLSGTGSNYVSEGQANDLNVWNCLAFGVLIRQSTSSFFQKHYFDDFSVGPIITDTLGPQLQSITVIGPTQLQLLFDEPLDSVSVNDTLHYQRQSNGRHPVSAKLDSLSPQRVHLIFSDTFNSGMTDSLLCNSVSDLAGNLSDTSASAFIYYDFQPPGWKDILFNELMPDPNPVVGLPSAEYRELYNRSDHYIQLSGLKLSDASSTVALPGYTFAPGSYLVLYPLADTAAFQLANIQPRLGLNSFPSLGNVSDHLYLRTNTNALIDSIYYADTWYRDEDKDDGGWSLELISPFAPLACPVSDNWRASLDTSGGSPGRINSVYSTVSDQQGPLPLAISVNDSLHLVLCFNEFIPVVVLENISLYNLGNGPGISAAESLKNGTCVKLTLSAPLNLSQNYQIHFAGISDCNGNAVQTTTLDFSYYIAKEKDLMFNELMIDPDPAIGLPNAEYIELFNQSPFYISIHKWQIVSNTVQKPLPDQSIAPGSYALLCNTSQAALFETAGIPVIAVNNLPALNNTAGKLILRDSAGLLIDSLSYSNAWYGDDQKENGGYSLEQINPDHPCGGMENWKASADTAGGTPGFQNSVYNTAPDLQGPTALSISVWNARHLLVSFGEPIPVGSLDNPASYRLDDTISILHAQAAANGRSVLLDLSTDLNAFRNYRLYYPGITDCSGNMAVPFSLPFSHYNARARDVIFNELMIDPDPAIGLPNAEYIELKNRTAFYISLKRWSISSPTTSKPLPEAFLAPDSFLVLVNKSDAALFANTGIPILKVIDLPALGNYGSSLCLRDSTGRLIATLDYTDDWYHDAQKSDGGFSLEQIDPDNPCGGADNWRASRDPKGGTPGKVNSVNASNPDQEAPFPAYMEVLSADTLILVFQEALDSLSLLAPSHYTIVPEIGMPLKIDPMGNDFHKVKLVLPLPLQKDILYHCQVAGSIRDCAGNAMADTTQIPFALPAAAEARDVVINEVLFHPATGVPDFVELYNRSKKTIDLKTLFLSRYDTLNHTLIKLLPLSPEGRLLFPEQYLLLSENGAILRQNYASPNPGGFLDVEELPAMNADAGSIALCTTDSLILDQFSYTEKMHFPLLVTTQGVSLERIHFDRPTADRSNWNSAAAQVGFATPAYRNSQFLNSSAGNGPVSIPHPIFSPDNDGFEDVLDIHYAFSEPGTSTTMTFYDASGRTVRQLSHNESFPGEGTISWNGITDANEKAPIGIYVLLVEIYRLNGETHSYKLSCVLAGKL